MVSATTTATQMTVRTRMPGRLGLSKTWLKLLSPADPTSIPSGVMFRNEVWNITTIGYTTTRQISAIAGPVHASGVSRFTIRWRPFAGVCSAPGSGCR